MDSIMDGSTDFNQEVTSRFYRTRVNESLRRWYVKRVELYIQRYTDERLRSHSARHVVNFLAETGREAKLSDWHYGNLLVLFRSVIFSRA